MSFNGGLANHPWSSGLDEDNFILLFYMDVITYSCPNHGSGLANLC